MVSDEIFEKGLKEGLYVDSRRCKFCGKYVNYAGVYCYCERAYKPNDIGKDKGYKWSDWKLYQYNHNIGIDTTNYEKEAPIYREKAYGVSGGKKFHIEIDLVADSVLEEKKRRLLF